MQLYGHVHLLCAFRIVKSLHFSWNFMLMYLETGRGWGGGHCNGKIVQTSLLRSSVGPISFSVPESPLAVICSVYSLNHHV